MPTLRRFEDIEAWRVCRRLSSEVYRVTKQGAFLQDRPLAIQLQRAAVSAAANNAEGFGRGARNEFIVFLGYAMGSLREIQSHLYIVRDQGYIDTLLFEALYHQAEKAANASGALIRYLRKSPIKGIRYK